MIRKVMIARNGWVATELNGSVTAIDPRGVTYRFPGVIWEDFYGSVLRAFTPSGYVDGDIEGVVQIVKLAGCVTIEKPETIAYVTNITKNGATVIVAGKCKATSALRKLGFRKARNWFKEVASEYEGLRLVELLMKKCGFGTDDFTARKLQALYS